METYTGQVKSPADAIILFEACRLGLLPRIQRRLSEKERQLIKSGSVFVWDEREAGMRRWTDGKSWSASRVSGSFLTYREMEGKRSGVPNATSSPLMDRDGKKSSQDMDMGISDGPDGYRYKADGLMKQSFSITTSTGQHLHLISYHARSHPHAATLQTPSNDPNLRHIRPAKGMYPESAIHDQHNLPAVTRSPMVASPFNTSPQQHMGPNTQNYLRHQPPPPPSAAAHSPAYSAWPPSPMTTPNSTYYTSPHNGYLRQDHNSPANPSNSGPPPVYFSQPAYARNQAPTAFDRAPPPLSNMGWPPPPPPSHSSQPPSHQQPSSYPPPQYYSSPQHPPPSSHHHSSYPPPHAPTSAPAPPYRPLQDHSGRPLDGPPHSTPPGSRPLSSHRNSSNAIDQHGPKLASPQLPQGNGSPFISHSRQNSSPRLNGTSRPSPQAPKEPTKMIPSIGALINRSDSPEPRPIPPSSAALSVADDRGRFQTGQSTPERASNPPSGGPRYATPANSSNMPEKIQFGEDVRAIRQLDRAFAA